MLLAAMTAMVLIGTGCSRAAIKTRDITFIRAEELNQGRPCAVDVIYPRDAAERDQILTQIGPDKWFTSPLYDKVYKDKAWLEPDSRDVVLKLQEKRTEDRYMIVFAEFTTPEASPPRGRVAYLAFEEDKDPEAKKHEYVYMHEGSMERLKNKRAAKKMMR
jgi:hypothetical protein